MSSVVGYYAFTYMVEMSSLYLVT